MEGHLEALLEIDFCTKPPNFGVEAHMEAPTGDALTRIALLGSSVHVCLLRHSGQYKTKSNIQQSDPSHNLTQFLQKGPSTTYISCIIYLLF
jgi:hypothetical protein